MIIIKKYERLYTTCRRNFPVKNPYGYSKIDFIFDVNHRGVVVPVGRPVFDVYYCSDVTGTIEEFNIDDQVLNSKEHIVFHRVFTTVGGLQRVDICGRGNYENLPLFVTIQLTITPLHSRARRMQ